MKTQDAPAPPSCAPFTYRACKIVLRSGHAYFGTIEEYRFCGSCLTLRLAQQVEAHPVEGPGELEEFIVDDGPRPYEYAFTGCAVNERDNDRSTRQSAVSETGDHITLYRNELIEKFIAQLISEGSARFPSL